MGGFDTRSWQPPARITQPSVNGVWQHTTPRWPGGAVGIKAGCVYSYRSSPLLADSFAGQTPGRRKGQSVGSVLSERLSFYERINQSLVSEASTQTFATSAQGLGTTRYDSVDLGHDFTSLQWRGVQGIVKVENVHKTKPSLSSRSRTIGSFTNFPGPTFHGLPPDHCWMTSSSIRSQFPATEARNMLTQLVPKTGGLGETVIELLSLRLPSLLSSFRTLARQVDAKRVALSKAERNRIARDLLNSGFAKPGSRSYYRAHGFISRSDKRLAPVLAAIPPSKSGWIRAVGSDYLEVAFGLLPVLEVLADILSGMQEAEDRIYGASFRRRRRRTLSEGSLVVDQPWVVGPKANPSGTGFAPAGSTTRIPALWTYKETLQVTVRATTHGRLSALSKSAYADSRQSFVGLLRRMGLRSPSLGWEILPYSWLVDWFANFSAGLKRREFFQDAYPVDYAYATYKFRGFAVPHKMQVEHTSGNYRSTYSSNYWTSRLEVTVRKRLDPFGNPWTGVSIDPYKAGILSALGLSNVRGRS